LKLSEHFTLEELTKSETALRLGIENKPDEDEIVNLVELCNRILEPVRKHFGIPFSPNSAYRGPKLNKAIGASSKSQHQTGHAVDIELVGVDNYELAKWIEGNLNFDQLILEFYTGHPSSGWVHISLIEEFNRRKVNTFDGKKWMNGLIQ